MHEAFYNVDLEVEHPAEAQLKTLLRAMGKQVILMYLGRAPRGRGHFLSVESGKSHRTPDAAIRALVLVIAKLPPAARDIWVTSTRRFDIGFELPPGASASQFALLPSTVALVGKDGATVAVTCYRGRTDEPWPGA